VKYTNKGEKERKHWKYLIECAKWVKTSYSSFFVLYIQIYDIWTVFFLADEYMNIFFNSELKIDLFNW